MGASEFQQSVYALFIYCPPLTVTKAAEGSSREAELSAHVSATFTLPMSTKKRARPSPAADSAQPEIDDAALRKALGDQKRAKSKAPFADGACLGALTQTAAPSIGVVTLFSALALNYYIKNGPTLSEVAQSCLDIKYGYSTPPPLPNLSKSSRAGTSEARDWCRRAWLSEVQGGPLPSGSEAEIKKLYKVEQQKQRRKKLAAERVWPNILEQTLPHAVP